MRARCGERASGDEQRKPSCPAGGRPRGARREGGGAGEGEREGEGKGRGEAFEERRASTRASASRKGGARAAAACGGIRATSPRRASALKPTGSAERRHEKRSDDRTFFFVKKFLPFVLRLEQARNAACFGSALSRLSILRNVARCANAAEGRRTSSSHGEHGGAEKRDAQGKAAGNGPGILPAPRAKPVGAFGTRVGRFARGIGNVTGSIARNETRSFATRGAGPNGSPSLAASDPSLGSSFGACSGGNERNTHGGKAQPCGAMERTRAGRGSTTRARRRAGALVRSQTLDPRVVGRGKLGKRQKRGEKTRKRHGRMVG